VPEDAEQPDEESRHHLKDEVEHLKEEVEEELHEARSRAHDARLRVREAAIGAELATGKREETVEEARAGVIKRTVRIGIGSFVLLAGLLMMVLPGPGLLVIAIGLGILSRDVAWAERLLERIRHRLPQDEEGAVSKPVIATSVVIALAAVAGSIWFMFR
jgi:uncharacterized protein (TIGR02611 family)